MLSGWVRTLMVVQLALITAGVDWCNLRCDRGLLHTMCGFEGGSSGRHCRNMQDTMTPSKRADLLHWHNSYRNNFAEGKLRVPGNFIIGVANMRQMTYYDDLEIIAQKWAEQCIPAHDVCRTTAKFEGEVGFNSGQNFGTQKSDLGIPSDESTRYNFLEWANQRKNVPGVELASFGRTEDHQQEFVKSRTWSHWTQLVWANSYTLGCSEVVYEVEGQFERTTFCNYGPGGNLRGQRVFRIGPPCSRCPRGTSCRFDSEYPSLCALPSDPKFHQDFIMRYGHHPESDVQRLGDEESDDGRYQDELEGRNEEGYKERANLDSETDDHKEPNKQLWHVEPGQHESVLERQGGSEAVEHVEPGKHEPVPVEPEVHRKMYQKHMEPGRHEIKDPKAGPRKHMEPGRHELLPRKHKEPGRHEPEPGEHMEPGKHETALSKNHRKTNNGTFEQEVEQHKEPGEHEPKLEEHDEPGEHEVIRPGKRKKRPRILYGGRAGPLGDVAAAAAKAVSPAAAAAVDAAGSAAVAAAAAAAPAAVSKAAAPAAAALAAVADDNTTKDAFGANDTTTPGGGNRGTTSGCDNKWMATDKRLSLSLSFLLAYLLREV